MPLTRVDHVAIAVRDISAPLAFYSGVLQLPVFEHTAENPAYAGDIPGTPLAWVDRAVFLPVGGSAVALLEASSGKSLHDAIEARGEGVHYLCFVASAPLPCDGRLLPLDDHLGLGIATVAEGDGFGPPSLDRHPLVENIDHIVIASNDSAATAAHFRESLGVEIKRTMTRPGTGAHLEFAKLDDVILEFAGPPEPRPGTLSARYWGIVFTVSDIDEAVARTRAAGIRCDDPKPAVQPGAKIAGVKESTGGVPFAFIQYNARPAD
jgi:catechol 2,3-dioxygenase-like lactoylglutathione lyase family enzyme